MTSRSASGTNMRTPTSDLSTAPENPVGLPDVATLARMANAFFTALPGVLPTQAGTAVPEPLPADFAVTELTGVPAGAALPAPAAPPTSPFYFLDFAGPWRTGSRRLRRPPYCPGLRAWIWTRCERHRCRRPGRRLRACRQAHRPRSISSTPNCRMPMCRPLQGVGQHPPFNVAAIRRDFPILAERVNGRPLIWLDNAATTQKPQAVIDRLAHFYAHENSNIHRAAHELAARATDAYEGARATVKQFLGASSAEEIVFVRGATEAINLVAQSWGPAEHTVGRRNHCLPPRAPREHRSVAAACQRERRAPAGHSGGR